MLLIRHLYKQCENSNLAGTIRFVDPYPISHDDNVDSSKRASIIGARLTGTKPNELVLVPCNVRYVKIG